MHHARKKRDKITTLLITEVVSRDVKVGLHSAETYHNDRVKNSTVGGRTDRTNGNSVRARNRLCNPRRAQKNNISKPQVFSIPAKPTSDAQCIPLLKLPVSHSR
jgi:hypothetical protein